MGGGNGHLLDRRIKVGLTGQGAYQLTRTQIEQDIVIQNFAEQARDPYTLAAVLAGGVVAKGIEGVGYAKILPFVGDSKIAAALFKAGIHTTAVAGNAATFVSTERILKVTLADADPSLLEWQGDNGIKNGFESAFVNFAALQIAGKFTGNQNPFLRHVTSSGTMVAANQMTGALGFTPTPTGSLVEQWAHASALDLQMQSGMQMLHTIFPSLALPKANDPSLWQKNSLTGEVLANYQDQLADVLLEHSALSIFLSPESIGWLEGKSLGSIRGDLQAAEKSDVSWLRFRFFFRFLNTSGKQALAKDLISLLEKQDLSQKNIIFALKALPRTFADLDPAQKSNIVDHIKSVYDAIKDPAYRLRWLYLLRDLMPHLEAATRLKAMRLALEADLSPHPGLAEPADSILYKHLETLSAEELMDLGEHLSVLDLPQTAGIRVRQLINFLSREVASKIDSAEGDRKENHLRVARWLGKLIASRESIIAGMATLCWLDFIQKLPVSDARTLVAEYKTQFSKDSPNYFYWAVFAESQLAHPETLNEVTKTWHEQRREEALEYLSKDLQILRLPEEWSDLTEKINRMSNVADLLEIQKDLQAKFRSPDPIQQRVLEQWWDGLWLDSQRWITLELFVGPKRYIPLKGEEALRLRKLVGEGLAQETGIASKQNSVGNADDVLFVLGNHNSVGLPDAYISEVGPEEAAKYLMIHHTHPHSVGGSDINQIYPSTYTEGGGGGDLHALFTRFEKMQEGENIGLSVTHGLGGSIFVLRKQGGKAFIDIYSGIKTAPTNYRIQDIRLVQVRAHILEWAQREGITLRFFETPYDHIEGMQFGPSSPQVREIRD